MDLLTEGNAAKLYCLNWLDRYAASKPDATILDLGCGRAHNFVKLLQKHPNLRYVGIEPSPAACELARRNMAGLNATIINGFAYDVYGRYVQEQFDVIVSFSVFEHVYRRLEYLKAAKACLKPEGYFLINYDAGHFIQPASFREWAKNKVGPLLARLGRERYYQSFVHDKTFHALLPQAGFRILEVRGFNTRLKGVYKLIPPDHRDEYMRRWLDFESWLSDLNLPYDDSRADTWFTRNYVLTHA